VDWTSRAGDRDLRIKAGEGKCHHRAATDSDRLRRDSTHPRRVIPKIGDKVLVLAVVLVLVPSLATACRAATETTTSGHLAEA
jgi:hypothetical protein